MLLYDAGSSYSTINTARSALSAVLPSVAGVSFGALPVVARFMKGVYNSRPTTARYSEIWDVRTMLACLQKWYPLHKLSLKVLTYKLVMLLLLVSGNRGQSLQLLDLKNLVQGTNSFTFMFDKVLKQSRPGVKQPLFVLKPYDRDVSLCVVRTLKAYLLRTHTLRKGHSQLLISYIAPHEPVSRDTISRWVRAIFDEAGLAAVFKPHSTRAASTSAAKRADVHLEDILSKAGWASDCTFRKHYDRPVLVAEDTFANAVLRM